MFINSALKSTEKMLKKTFETGISEEEYYANADIFDLTSAKSWNSYSDEYQDNQYTPAEMCEYVRGY